MATPGRASAIVEQMLSDYGLRFSRDLVNRWVGLLSDDPDNMSIVMEEIRGSSMFKNRFKGMDRRIANGYNAISVNEYLALENEYQSLMRASGMPRGFYDSNDDFAEFIANDVSVNELEERISRGYVAAMQAPDEVRRALKDYYGIGQSNSALAAYYIDPDRALPTIQREFEAAQLRAVSEQTGYEGLTRRQAERLAALGIEDDQAREGFSQIGMNRELFTSNLGIDQNFDEDEVLEATFEANAALMNQIRRQRNMRQSLFEGAEGVGLSRGGMVGLASTGGSAGP